MNIGGLVILCASIVVPVYNEEKILVGNAMKLSEYLNETLAEYEVIIVENGSSDDSLGLAERLADKNPLIRTLNLPEPCLGEAIKTGVADSRYDKIVYFPIDLSVNLDFIPRSIELLDPFDIVVGSKTLKDARDHRPLNRRLASTGYHKAVQFLFKTDLSDTTCVKAYRRTVVMELIDLVPSESSVFETELLLEAQRAGADIVEVPVLVDDQRRGRLQLGYKMASKGQDLLSLRIDILSMIAGSILFLSGLIGIIYLSAQKLVFNRAGFLNPYSFLIAMLLVLFGAQGIAYGLFARLLLQLRREIMANNNHRGSGNVFKEEGK